MQHLHEILWQYHIINIHSTGKQRSDLTRSEASNAASDACHKEGIFRVVLGESDEFVYVWLDSLYTSLYSGNGIALSLQSYALSPDSTKIFQCDASCSTSRVSPLHYEDFEYYTKDTIIYNDEKMKTR